MDSFTAFAMGEANRGKELMVFDWDKAARIIKERGATTASAGLRFDWDWTGGLILCDGKPYNDGITYLASTWAVPELDIDGEIMPCYRMKSEVPNWGADTKWPESALAILNVPEEGASNSQCARGGIVTGYTTHIVAMIVAPKGQHIYSEQATRVEIQDDAAGPYIELSQEDGKVRIDPEEWPELRDAIETMIAAAARLTAEE